MTVIYTSIAIIRGFEFRNFHHILSRSFKSSKLMILEIPTRTNILDMGIFNLVKGKSHASVTIERIERERERESQSNFRFNSIRFYYSNDDDLDSSHSLSLSLSLSLFLFHSLTLSFTYSLFLSLSLTHSLSLSFTLSLSLSLFHSLYFSGCVFCGPKKI